MEVKKVKEVLEEIGFKEIPKTALRSLYTIRTELIEYYDGKEWIHMLREKGGGK